MIKVRVIDMGVGIKQEDLGRIFELLAEARTNGALDNNLIDYLEPMNANQLVQRLGYAYMGRGAL